MKVGVCLRAVFLFAALFVLFGAHRAMAAVILAEQTDGATSTIIASKCNNGCSDVVFGSEGFIPAVSANLGSIEVFTADFTTNSANPRTNVCGIALYDVGGATPALLASSDASNQGDGESGAYAYRGPNCGGDLVFTFANSLPFLEAGKQYRWDFVFHTQNFTTLTFFGSANDSVGGVFNSAPVVNAKFTALAGIPEPIPISMRQTLFDGATDIAEGNAVAESKMTFIAAFASSFSETLQLQVEVRPAEEPFTGNFDSGIATSSFVAAGMPAAVSMSNADGLWRWRARFADADGRVSNWADFGAPDNADFITQTAPLSGDPSLFAEQADGSAMSHTNIRCNNECRNVTVASQVFTALRSGNLSSIEIFTANFVTNSSNPDTNDCRLRILDNATGAVLAESDDNFTGSSCGGDIVFHFNNASPPVHRGTRYRWDFYWGTQNFTRLDFFGSPNNLVGGIFSPGPAVNAKFIARGSGFFPEPVVIVPGIMGSRLNRASDGAEAWPHISQMIASSSDKYLDDLKLDANGNQLVKISVADIIRSESVLGGVINESFYKNLIDQFFQSGYVENQNLFVAPYDWRLDIASSTETLAAKIQEAVAASPNGKVNIIAHSMGGLLVKNYLANLPAGSHDFLDKLILAGVPQLGAPQAFKLLNFGDDMGLNFFGLGLNQDEAKNITQNMPGGYELLPSRRYVGVAGSYVHDFRDGGNHFLDYDAANQFMASDPNDSRNGSLLVLADAFHAGLDAEPVNASSVSNIVGCFTPTPAAFRFYDNGVVDIERASGDGTVPQVSAMNLANSFNNYFVLGNETGIDHAGLVKDARPLALIKNIIDGTASSTPLPEGVSTFTGDCFAPRPQFHNETTIEFSAHSPVNLHAYDSQNRHTGPLPNGDIELGIPGSTYEKIGENSFILVPAGNAYKIIAQALSAGTFTLKAKGYEGSNIDQEVIYVPVPLAGASTTAELNFTNFQGNMNLELDADGNGAFDSVIAPIAFASVSSTADITPPDIILPPLPEEILQNSTATLIFSASDADSGIAIFTATLNGVPVLSGDIVAFAKTGNNVFIAEAVDNAGNPRMREIDFEVRGKQSSVPSGGAFFVGSTPAGDRGGGIALGIKLAGAAPAPASDQLYGDQIASSTRASSSALISQKIKSNLVRGNALGARKLAAVVNTVSNQPQTQPLVQNSIGSQLAANSQSATVRGLSAFFDFIRSLPGKFMHLLFGP